MRKILFILFTIPLFTSVSVAQIQTNAGVQYLQCMQDTDKCGCAVSAMYAKGYVDRLL